MICEVKDGTNTNQSAQANVHVTSQFLSSYLVPSPSLSLSLSLTRSRGQHWRRKICEMKDGTNTNQAAQANLHVTSPNRTRSLVHTSSLTLTALAPNRQPRQSPSCKNLQKNSMMNTNPYHSSHDKRKKQRSLLPSCSSQSTCNFNQSNTISCAHQLTNSHCPCAKSTGTTKYLMCKP